MRIKLKIKESKTMNRKHKNEKLKDREKRGKRLLTESVCRVIQGLVQVKYGILIRRAKRPYGGQVPGYRGRYANSENGVRVCKALTQQNPPRCGT